MKTDIVTFSTALLARDKGYINGSDFYFDINTEHLFVWNDMIGSIGCTNKLSNPEQIEAPYRAELQKWLRDKHNIHVEVSHNHDRIYYAFINDEEYEYIHDGFGNVTKFTTYESALEEGLKQGLTLIEI